MQFVGGTTITLALCRTACDAARLIVGRSGGHPNLGNEVTAQLILAGELTGFPTLLANRDARTEVTSFQVYNFKMRAQIGTSNVEN